MLQKRRRMCLASLAARRATTGAHHVSDDRTSRCSKRQGSRASLHRGEAASPRSTTLVMVALVRAVPAALRSENGWLGMDPARKLAARGEKIIGRFYRISASCRSNNRDMSDGPREGPSGEKSGAGERPPLLTPPTATGWQVPAEPTTPRLNSTILGFLSCTV